MRTVLSFLLLALGGCSSTTIVDGGAHDGGREAGPVDASGSDGATDLGVPTPDAGTPCGDEMSLHCGASLGLDPGTLYSCSMGMLSVADHCVGACVVHTDGSDDACPCPAGDGTYCGARVPGGAANTIYACAAGHYTAAHTCATHCTAGTGASDACPPCPFGDGAYCGASAGAETYILYHCGGGVITPQATCQSTCMVEPPGTNDQCAPCEFGAGTYCGAAAHGDPNTLYDCHADGSISAAMVCAGTCHSSPPGVPDYCPGTCTGGLVCSHNQWWNAHITYGPYTITNGGMTWWDTDLGLGDRTPVQLRHDSVLIQDPVEAWGWQPRFRDLVTGETFQFLHLHPDARYTTTVGMTYCAGTVVGLSGGGDYATGCCLPDRYSSGPHLCVETLAAWRTAFPAGMDACM